MEGTIGTIILFAGNFAPRSWALCQGQLLSISQNTALFSILGTTYGGDGRTTFGLPDLRSRVPLQQGAGPGLSNHSLGAKAGTETNTLQVANLPAHNHVASLNVSSANASQNVATAGSTIGTPGSLSGRTFTATEGFNTAAPNVKMNAGSVSTENTGSGTPVNNIQPSLALNYVICLFGTFPSRN
jgi:microcystin-dependent protein